MKAIITGSFDPITTGHIQIIKEAGKMFCPVYVVALFNKDKEPFFSLEQRKEIMQKSLQGIDNVIIDTYSGLTADYMHLNNISVIVRGIRTKDDLKYEEKLASIMKEYDPGFNTVFIQSEEKNKEICSSKVRQYLSEGHSIKGYVSPNAESLILSIFNDYIKNK